MVPLSTEGHFNDRDGAELSPSSDKRAVLIGEDEVLQPMMLRTISRRRASTWFRRRTPRRREVLQSGVSLDRGNEAGLGARRRGLPLQGRHERPVPNLPALSSIALTARDALARHSERGE